MPNSNAKKPHNLSLGSVAGFFTPHPDATPSDAQDVVCELVRSAKDISTATFHCFDGGTKLIVKDEIVSDLIFELQTKLEMIEKLLPMAFEYEGGDK